MKSIHWKAGLLLALLSLASACATLSPEAVKSWGRPAACQDFLNRLDASVMETGVRDAASHPIPGFPYLRADRFLAALKNQAKDEAQRDPWVRWMQALDLEGRKREIDNLPEDAVLTLGGEKGGRKELYSRVESCSSQILQHDKKRLDFYASLGPSVEIPDEYSTFLQVVGLYPITAIPVWIATGSSRKRAQSWFDGGLGTLCVDGRLEAFSPKEGISLDGKEVAGMMEEMRKNSLKVPLPDPRQEELLVRAFAPVFIQDVVASYDRLGRVYWKGERVEVDPEKPTVYYYLSHAFLKGEPILQISYVIWYSDRAGDNAPGIERGHLDGLTLRVSLDDQGNPFMVDVVSDCGCYHLFAPAKGMVKRVVSWPDQPSPFVPQWLPAFSAGERLGIRVNSGWHRVQRIIAVKEGANPVPYELIPYDLLESLPHENGRRESIFDAQGIAKGSERPERFFLFPMGIPKVGSMRQRGHHAIEFLARVHFDDPDLFDHYFDFR